MTTAADDSYKPTQVYRHYDKDGDLLYVGLSGDPIYRFDNGHAASSHWADDVTKVESTEYPTRRLAEMAEQVAIATEEPIHNRRRPGIERRKRPAQINFQLKDEAMLDAFRSAAHDQRMSLSAWCRSELVRASGYDPD